METIAMNGTTFSVEFPHITAQRLHDRAQRSQRSVEEEIRELVTVSIGQDEEEIQRLVSDLKPMETWPDEELAQAARNPLAQQWVDRLDDLNLKQQREGLTPTEKETAATLAQAIDKYVLVRSNALALLKSRGQDVTALLGPP